MDRSFSQNRRYRSVLNILTGKNKGKRPPGRPRWRWEDNTTLDLKEIGNNLRNWVDSAQNRNYWRALVNAALNLGFHNPWN